MTERVEIGAATLIRGECLEVMRGMESNSVDLILTDPPYFKVKNEPWDRQWDKPAAFLEWIGTLCAEWQRILRPNGSLYVFASPKMSARVECKVGEWFSVLNRIRWVKEAGWHQKAEKEALRSYLSPWEECIFAEHHGADNIAKGEAGYAAKCDELRGFVFEPLRAYLDGERERAGLSVQDVAEAWRIRTGNENRTGMAGHWFSVIQWALPTETNYAWLRALFNRERPGEYLRREYEDLRREYEDLRREYEDLRRPFSVSADVPYTDVWTFPTVSNYPGKHPCEKPLAMLKHIVSASSREGATVLDCFMGGGSAGHAALDLGRKFIGIEVCPDYFARAVARIGKAGAQMTLDEQEEAA